MQVLPSQISPGENFDIFYFFRDPNDTGAHYVQAKIYDLKTGTVLATFGLDQAPTNSRLFIKTTQAPADPPGYGRNIVAVATVYSDSGYASPDLNYPEQEQYFLIKNAPVIGGGGGFDGRALIDHIDAMLDKKLAALPKPPEPIEPPPFPSEALFGAIGALQREINRIPKDEADDTAMLDAIEKVRTAVAALPEPEQTDLDPVLQAIAELHTALSQQEPKMVAAYEAAMQAFGDETIQKVEAALKDFLGRQQLHIPIADILKDSRDKPKPVDVDHLMAV
jgi:hypothetical protein